MSAVYACGAGHLVVKPDHGEYHFCPYRVPLREYPQSTAPCGRSLLIVPDPDGRYEVAHRLGGRDAVMALLRVDKPVMA